VSRPLVALLLLVICLLVTFGLRSLMHYRLTGESGLEGISGRPGSAEWFGGVLFVIALLLGGAAPVLELAELIPPLFVPPRWLLIAGALVVAIGTGLTFWAQHAMGRSWRIGVNESAATELVTGGPFGYVRNPIFSFLLVTMAGLVLLLPNLLAVVAWPVLLVAIELQVRWVEEPYLLGKHGERYAAYVARVGRLVPRIGRRIATARRAR
jgi:protein-S-isoprenylcysteine O-methyltransferase Ste14